MKQPVLSIKDLSISLNKKGESLPLVSHLSFDIFPGETVALVGESGSGKSLTARAIMQLLDQKHFTQTGAVIFQKKDSKQCDLLELSEQGLQQFRGDEAAMIFQEPMTSLNPMMTIGDQLTEAILVHQKIKKHQAAIIAISELEKVRMPSPKETMKKFPHELSGGQKQRVMIAMAMCNKPALLIADEPTTALDTITQKEVLKLLDDLKEKTGMGLLFITHDMGIVEEIADRVIIMHKGSIVEQGEAKQIFSTPGHDYTRHLLACRPLHYIKGKRITLANDPPLLSDAGQPNLRSYKEEARKNIIQAKADVPILEVKNLSITYPGKKRFFAKAQPGFDALKDINIHIHQGETVGIVGESGCGKTTLARAILGFIEPSAGTISFREEKYIASNIQNRHQEIQMVFQDPYASLNPRIEIGKAIEEPLIVHKKFRNKKEANEYAEKLLKKVRLTPDYYNRYPHQLSGGQRQRIVIARALAMQPDFIIWDESVSALDVSLQAQILNLINDLKHTDQFSSLFISHDLSVVKYICDRVYIMQQGKIVEEGKPEIIWESPQHPYTRQLLDAIPGRNA